MHEAVEPKKEKQVDKKKKKRKQVDCLVCLIQLQFV
jgi:hypothetical protein